ncbi:MAG TPA: hypothetical protein VGZ73_29990 [Bryobacteraceae bacterium]|jgi:hypothetical protein|nr:hypothetical protein [Bryobacteraceae bacterium]
MQLKSLFFAGALALASLSIASAKSYQITVDEPTQAGTVQLKAGDYRVKVDGSNAVFTNVDSGKSITTPVKVENTGTKHDVTAVQTSKATGRNKMTAIELGGTDETLEFGE